MTTKEKQPEAEHGIKPCPCGKGCNVMAIPWFYGYAAQSGCGWTGPTKMTKYQAIAAWNERET